MGLGIRIGREEGRGFRQKYIKEERRKERKKEIFKN